VGEKEGEEAAWLKKASPEAKKRHNRQKLQAAMKRKLDECKKRGMKPKTLGIIVNMETKVADLYELDGFHLSVHWNSAQAEKAHVGSFRYA
jgi:hypothetical protein